MSTRRPRVDSAEEQARIAAAANKTITSDRIPLWDHEKPFFDAIITERAKADWTDHMIDMAAVLAKQIAKLAADPEHTRLAASIVAMRRSLGLHSQAKDGDLDKMENRRNLSKDIENGALDASEDDFIARPFN